MMAIVFAGPIIGQQLRRDWNRLNFIGRSDQTQDQVAAI
jgi:hypothetical protein